MIFFGIAALLFTGKRLLRYLRYLQQDAYLPLRFLHWVWKEKAFDRKGTAIVLLAVILPFSWSWHAGAALLTAIALWEHNPLKQGKLTLQLTPRATRIAATAFTLYLPLQYLAAASHSAILQILLFQMTPLFLIAANGLLAPGESRSRRHYVREAKNALEKVNPFVIGITGSYGKTSTKNALAQLIQITLGPAFWPQQGINTEMGISRSIRESLKPFTEYAVIEMAAYGRGSIKRLCSLTPPKAGIITGVGLAHLDRFGSEETIYQAKSELAQAIPEEGILVCNGDNAGARKMASDYRKKTTLLYGLDNNRSDLDCVIIPMQTTFKGTHFSLIWKGQTYDGFTPLHGESALSNCAGAFTLACALGANPQFAVAALSTLAPVRNRLQMTTDNKRTYIHDAYNSNPDGFISALNVLKQLPAKKKILMTPGMVELADRNEEMHRKVGKYAAGICNLAIIVGKTNRDSLNNGLLDGGLKQAQVIHAEHRSEAFEQLSIHLEQGDAVLIENDLPDLYENRETF
jgi:UDP-N-acetylmuramoyl-tripeptide--D-alanyl-D-alanine ligase